MNRKLYSRITTTVARFHFPLLWTEAREDVRQVAALVCLKAQDKNHEKFLARRYLKKLEKDLFPQGAKHHG